MNGGTALAFQFQLFTDANDRYRFRFVASDGTVMLTSEAYAGEAAAAAGITAVREIAAAGLIVDRTDSGPLALAQNGMLK